MALVTDIKWIEKEGHAHGPSKCGCFVVQAAGGARLLTIETYGSQTRKIRGKVSQSIQLGERAAKQLKVFIEQVFPHLK